MDNNQDRLDQIAQAVQEIRAEEAGEELAPQNIQNDPMAELDQYDDDDAITVGGAKQLMRELQNQFAALPVNALMQVGQAESRKKHEDYDEEVNNITAKMKDDPDFLPTMMKGCEPVEFAERLYAFATDESKQLAYKNAKESKALGTVETHKKTTGSVRGVSKDAVKNLSIEDKRKMIKKGTLTLGDLDEMIELSVEDEEARK